MNKHILNRFLKTCLLISLAITSTQVFAEKKKETTGSNLTNFTYPTHSCGSNPSKPAKIPGLASFIDVDAYNIAIAQYNVQVAIYNKNIKPYKKCINSYINSGNADIEVIKKQLNSALKEARSGD